MTLSNSADASCYQDAQEIFDIKESVTWPVEYSAMHACSVTQSCPTLCDPMDCSLPGSSVCGIFQARILEWVAFPFSSGSSQSRDRSQIFCIAGRFVTSWATREAQWSLQLILKLIISQSFLRWSKRVLGDSLSSFPPQMNISIGNGGFIVMTTEKK